MNTRNTQNLLLISSLLAFVACGGEAFISVNDSDGGPCDDLAAHHEPGDSIRSPCPAANIDPLQDAGLARADGSPDSPAEATPCCGPDAADALAAPDGRAQDGPDAAVGDGSAPSDAGPADSSNPNDATQDALADAAVPVDAAPDAIAVVLGYCKCDRRDGNLTPCNLAATHVSPNPDPLLCPMNQVKIWCEVGILGGSILPDSVGEGYGGCHTMGADGPNQDETLFGCCESRPPHS